MPKGYKDTGLRRYPRDGEAYIFTKYPNKVQVHNVRLHGGNWSYPPEMIIIVEKEPA